VEPSTLPGDEPPAPSRARQILTSLRSSRGGQRAERLAAATANWLNDPIRVLGLLLLAAFVLRVLWLNLPGRSLIFDEAYYVNAARVILGWPATSHYVGSPPGLDPNTEHPPLGKLLIAGSMALFGDNGVGWRLPSVIAGLVALVAVFGIVRSLDRRAWLGVFVVALVAFDNLTFVHGRIGTLDMLVLAPMLVGAWLALRRRWILAAVAMGIALLVKLTALYGIGAVVLYVLLTDGPDWWRQRRIPVRDLAGPAAFVIFALAFAFGGLGILDRYFTTYTSPFDHISRMVTYGANLQASVTPGICPEADSRPWQWLFNECQIQYLRVDSNIRAGDVLVSTVPRVDFRGAFNPFLAGAIPLAGLFAAAYAWRTRNRAAIWAIAWAAANYLPYLALAFLTPRVMYIFYALPLVPAISVGIALLLLDGGLPRFVRWGFLVAYAAGFVAYFPFRQIP
jgi:predicted membrane-bound dolichyl-phosphate-mannose-protein mannosyltransferase